MSQYDMNMQDYFRIIRKRKWIIILTTLAVYISAIVYVRMQTKLYRSTARIVIVDRISKSDKLLGVYKPKNNYTEEINLAKKIIKSRAVALRVINKLRLVEDGSTPEEINSVISSLQRRIKVITSNTSNVISIELVSSEPKKATMIVNKIAEAYKKESEKQARYSEQLLLEYLKEQLQISESKLKDSENDLLNYREEHALELTSNSSLNVQSVQSIQTKLENDVQSQKNYEEQIQLLRRKKNGEDIDVSSLSVIKNDVELNKIKEEINTNTKELEKLNRLYMPSHPRIYALKESLSRLKEQFNLLLDQKLERIISDLNKKIIKLRQERIIDRDKLKVYKNKIINLPRVQLELRKKERTYQVNNDLYNMFKKKLEEVRMKSVGQVGSLKMLEPADVPRYPFYPNERRSALAGLVIGLILGFAFAFIVESMDTSIGTIEDVEKYIQKTVLGVIPHIKVDSEKVRQLRKRIENAGEVFNERQARLISICEPKSPVTEAYRTLRTNLQFALPNKNGCNTLLVSSATPQEGKSTTLTNLAVIMAQANKKTLIMSCNLRHPSVYKIFGVKKKPGVTDILAGTISWREAIQNPGIDNLRILSAGPYPPNPSELLQSKEFEDLLNELKQEFDIILFDSPPILPVTDAAVIASKVDGVLLIYFVGKAAREALLRAKMQLDNVNANIVGLVLNDIKAEGKLAYTYYYHYQYKYYGVRDVSEV